MDLRGFKGLGLRVIGLTRAFGAFRELIFVEVMGNTACVGFVGSGSRLGYSHICGC